MLYAFSHANGIMVRGLAGDDLMLARINFIVLAQFRQAKDFRRLFCFAKNRKPMMTGSIAVVGRRWSVISRPSSSCLKPYALRLTPCFSGPSSSRLQPYALRLPRPILILSPMIGSQNREALVHKYLLGWQGKSCFNSLYTYIFHSRPLQGALFYQRF